jgi:CheY-like chemotaxis protein
MQLADATVLVVDDEEVLCEIMSAWFKKHAAHALRARDGKEALKLLADNRVDVIVSDVRMPVMDGVAMVRALAEKGAERPRVIFVTGFADLSARNAYHLGVEAIVEKPLERDHLLQAVKRSLADRNELWSRPLESMPNLIVQETFASLDEALREQRIAFGRGGFCLRTTRRLREAPVHFELEFRAEHTVVSGEGVVRWTEPAENIAGVEILHLDDRSRGWIVSIVEDKQLSPYIPRSPNQYSSVPSQPSVVGL